MIIKGIFELVYTLLSVVLAPFSLPALPDGIQSIFDEIVGYLTPPFLTRAVCATGATLARIVSVSD